MATNKERPAAKKPTAAKPPKAGADPRGADPAQAKPTGTVTQEHEHLAAPGRRRRLADIEGQDAPAKPKHDPLVTVSVPRDFRLQVLGEQGSQIVEYKAGSAVDMPRSHAEHDYSIANGVEIVDAD
jgi:hypothetical protein